MYQNKMEKKVLCGALENLRAENENVFVITQGY